MKIKKSKINVIQFPYKPQRVETKKKFFPMQITFCNFLIIIWTWRVFALQQLFLAINSTFFLLFLQCECDFYSNPPSFKWVTTFFQAVETLPSPTAFRVWEALKDACWECLKRGYYLVSSAFTLHFTTHKVSF